MTFQGHHRLEVRAQEVHQLPDVVDIWVPQRFMNELKGSVKHALNGRILDRLGMFFLGSNPTDLDGVTYSIVLQELVQVGVEALRCNLGLSDSAPV